MTTRLFIGDVHERMADIPDGDVLDCGHPRHRPDRLPRHPRRDRMR